MPLNFEQAAIQQPKIDIIGKEVPLQALEKTGDILQDRYDKSYEQYSMADEALKQMEASANEVDREEAKKLRAAYNAEMKGIVDAGDFHNMRHQTASLARNAAINYKTVAEKNASIQKELDAIAKDPRYRLDPEGARKHYLQGLKSIKFDPTTRTISDFNVGAYGAAADVDELDWSVKYGHLMKPTINKVTGAKIVGVDRFGKEITDPNQQPAMLMTKTKSGSLVTLSPEDIKLALEPAARADVNIQNRLNRDVERAGFDINTPEGQAYKEKLFQEQTLPAIGSAAGILKQDQDMSGEGIGFHNVPGDGDGGNGKKDPYDGWFVPATQTGGAPPANIPNPYYQTDAPQELIKKGILGKGKGWLWNDSITDDDVKENFNELLNSMDYGVENAKTPEQATRYKEAKQFFKDYKQLVKDFPEFSSQASEIHSRNTNILTDMKDLIGGGVENIRSLFGSKEKFDEFEKRRYEIDQRYGKFISSGFEDSDVEQTVEDYLKSDRVPVSTSTPMVSPSMMNTKAKAALAGLSSQVNPKDMNIYSRSEGFDPDKPYEFQKVSSEPFGNGTGVVFEVYQTDKDGHRQTALVEPNYQGNASLYDEFERESGIPIRMVNNFKNTRPFRNVGSKRSLGELIAENNLQGSDFGNILSSPELKDLNVVKTKNGYTIDKIVDPKTKKPMVFNSYIQGIHYITQRLR